MNRSIFFSFALLAGNASGVVVQMGGGTPYRDEKSDSWLYLLYTDYGRLSEFYLEDFEDHLLNTPYVTSQSLYESPFGEISMQQLHTMGLWGVAQSVDADDGVLDFIGAGDSWFGQVELRFSPNAEGRYPNYAGVVITQGERPTPLSIDVPAYLVYGPDGTLIYTGTLFGNTFGPSVDPNVTNDVFIGFYASEGISRLVPTPSFAYQIDHLQYGWAIPEPAVPVTMVFAGSVLLLRRKRRAR